MSQDNPFALNDAEDNSANPFSLGEQHASEPSSANPFELSDGGVSKVDRLAEASRRKLQALTKLNNKANLDDSYTDLGNGHLESNSNKIWNDMSGLEIQSLISHATKNYALSKDADGFAVDKDGDLFTGKTRRLYDFGTKAQSSDTSKIGLARGDYRDATGRYIKYPSGELGADINRLNSDILLPNDVAVMLEAAIHGRKEALANRVVKDRYSEPELAELYGGGSSEYYTSRAGALGEEVDINEGLGGALFREYMEKLPNKYRSHENKVDALGAPTNSAVNTLAGFASSFINELAVKPLDALGDATGWYDLDDHGDTTTAVEKAFGYDSSVVQESMERIGKHWDIAADSSLSVTERGKAAAAGIFEAFTTPEMFGTSLGMLTAWVSPGALLKAVGYGSKFAKTAAGIDEAVKAGTITKMAGRSQKAKEFMSIDGAASFLTSQSGFVSSALGNVNKQYEEFVGHNDYVELEGKEKAEWFAGRFAVQMVNQNLDKFVDLNVMKAPGTLKALIPAFKSATDKEFANMTWALGKGMLASGLAGGSEAIQEYAQTSMELFNARYKGAFTDVSQVVDFLSSDEIVRESGIAALAGIGGAGQFEVAGAASSSIRAGAGSTLRKGLEKSKAALKNKEVEPSEESTLKEPTEADKTAYKNLLKSTRKRMLDTGVTAGNVSSYLDDLAELNRTKHAIGTSSKESQRNGELHYQAVVNSLEEFIKKNPNTVLSKRLIKKTVKQSTRDAEVASEAEAVDSIPDSTKAAFSALAQVSGINDGAIDPKTAFTTVKKGIVGKTFETYVTEDGVIDEELQALEKELTGKVSEDLETTFNTLKTTLKGGSLKSILSKLNKDTAKENEKAAEEIVENLDKPSTVLGSGPKDTDGTTPNFDENEFEEHDYTDYTREVEAERTIRTILGSGKSYDKKFKTQLALFGLANGIDKERVGAVIKSFETVDDEAVRGDRGYAARLNRIASLATSGKENSKELAEEQADLLRMVTSIQKSEDALLRGIKSAKATAEKENRYKTPYAGEVKQETTEYKKFDGSFHKINIRHDGTKWVADTTYEEKLVKTKNSYIADVKKGLSKIHDNSPKGSGVESSGISGNVITPLKEGPTKRAREADVKYAAAMTKIIDKVAPDNKGINKVILGKSTHKKWAEGKDYQKANALRINGTEYAEDDVVLIDNTGVIPTSDGSYFKADFGSAAKKAFMAARKAGATFVLDRDMVRGKDSIKNRHFAHVLKNQLGESHGYMQLEGDGKSIFMKVTEERTANLDAINKVLKEKQDKKDIDIANKTKAVGFYRAIEAGDYISTGKPATPAQMAEMVAGLEKAKGVLLSTTFKDADKLDAFMRREAVDSVVKAAKDILRNPDAVPLEYDDIVFSNAIEAYIEAENFKDDAGAALMDDWNTTVKGEESRKDKDKSVAKIIKDAGFKAKSLINDILTDTSLVAGKKDVYEHLFKVVSTGEIIAIPKTKDLTKAEYEEHVLANSTKKKHVKYRKVSVFLGTRRVVQDLTKLVDVNKTTVANSLPVGYLPHTIRDAVATLADSAKAVLTPVQDAERNDGAASRDDNGNFHDGGFNLHNSPSRGLFFDNEGELNEEVMVAAYLAIGEMFESDKHKLLVGYKPDMDVARTFGVQEHELTQEMRQFAYSHGVPLKTLADKLGKSVLAQMGVAKKRGDDVAANEYKALVSDVGNTVSLIAEHMGLLKDDKPKSNDLAKLFKGGKILKNEAVTHFIKMAGKPDKESKFEKDIALPEVEKFIKAYDEIAEIVPEASTTRKEWRRSPPDEATMEKAQTVVRNDVSDKAVPDVGKEALDVLMNTKYMPDMELINEFLDAVDNAKYGIKEQLGYVEKDSDAYNALYYKDKEVQEAKNRDVERSISELRKLKIAVDDGKDADYGMFFDFFYASNDRYMMDSNTINPQTDKLHRFFVVPEAHELEYTVEVNDAGGVEFYVSGEDQSFMVRMAIAQAFAQDVDKMSPQAIIDFGNTMLSLDADQLDDVKDQILTHGKLDLDGGVKPYELEADHLSHTLQAIKFLNDTLTARTAGVVTSSLSLEFDSLTSGFANKIQQMPILAGEEMDAYLARIGIITVEYRKRLKDAINFKGKGVEFDPEIHSVADLLEIGSDGSYNDKNKDIADRIEFLDSYKSMAKDVVLVLRGGEKQDANLSTSPRGNGVSGMAIFDVIKPMLPGSDSINSSSSAVNITNAIRKLFKNPFMIFNYSAGVARIVGNLSSEISHELAKSWATTDLTKEDNEATKLVMEDLVSRVKLQDKAGKAIKTAEDLQKALRDERLKDISLVVPFMPQSIGFNKRKNRANNLEALLESVVSATYGEAVKDVFKESFEPFIKVQDAMNDTFKVAFRIFDKKRVDLLKERLKDKPESFLSDNDHKEVLSELWDDFPWIRGPLSGVTDKKDFITVVTTDTRNLNPVEESRKKPQALVSGGSTDSRTVTPLIKYLSEAVSSGSVLPFHAIDGAEMALTLTKSIAEGIEGVVAIHDAVIPPLNKADQVSFNYQKGMRETNVDYSLAEELGEMVKRINATIEGEGFDKEFKDVTALSIKATQEEEGTPFPKAARKVVLEMTTQVNKILKKRDEFYGEGGRLEGASYGNLVSSPGGMYESGMEKPNLNYKTKFKELYTEVKVKGEADNDSEGSYEEEYDGDIDDSKSNKEYLKKAVKDNLSGCK